MDWTRGRIIGHGSTATVYLSTSALTGDVFAVKSAELAQSEFLQREQKILSSLSSPYTVGYKGYDTTRENNKIMYNIFLEYMPGGSVIDGIRSSGGLLGEQVIRNYTWQVLQGLDYLHSNGLVHCDIKGRNILLGPDGAKIADFGCAKRVGPVQADTSRVAGTPMFMAPEVARREEQGIASDIWALGCTVIEMASGCAPWPDLSDPVSVIYRAGYSGLVPDFPCLLSEQARDFLDKCLRRDPKERWTASQLLKHPFLMGAVHPQRKPIQESNSITSSPTSILDQAFWNSRDEADSSTSLFHTRSPSSAGDKRIIRLISSAPVGPVLDCDDEDWVIVRGEKSGSSEMGTSDAILDDIEARGDGLIGEGLGRVVVVGKCVGGSEELLDSNIETRNIRGHSLGCCTYGKDGFVGSNSNYFMFERERDMLLILSRSILSSQA